MKRNRLLHLQILYSFVIIFSFFLFDLNGQKPFTDREASQFLEDTNQILYINIAIHYLQDASGKGNFSDHDDGNGNPNMDGLKFAQLFIGKANWELAHPAKNWKSSVEFQIPKVRYRFHLTGVFFHQDSIVYHIKSNDKVLHHPKLKEWAYRPNETINAYFINNSKNGTGQATDIGAKIGNALFVQNAYDGYLNYPDWAIQYYGSCVNHESGHLLDLYHTWNQDDKCDDTDLCVYIDSVTKSKKYCNCWAYKEGKIQPCNDWSNISNNIMDYSEIYPHAWTPCQAKRVANYLLTKGRFLIWKMDTIQPLAANFVTCNNSKDGLSIDTRLSSVSRFYNIKIQEITTGKNQKMRLKTIYKIKVVGTPRIINLSKMTKKIRSGKSYKIILSIDDYSRNQTESYEQDILIH